MYVRFLTDVVKIIEKFSSESVTHDNHVELLHVVMKSGADLVLLLIVLT